MKMSGINAGDMTTRALYSDLTAAMLVLVGMCGTILWSSWALSMEPWVANRALQYGRSSTYEDTKMQHTHANVSQWPESVVKNLSQIR